MNSVGVGTVLRNDVASTGTMVDVAGVTVGLLSQRFLNAANLQQNGLFLRPDGTINKIKFHGNQHPISSSKVVSAAKLSQTNLARMAPLTSAAGNTFTVASFGIDTYLVVNGEISGGRYAFRTARNFLGAGLAYIGLPQVGAALVGAGVGGEVVYDGAGMAVDFYARETVRADEAFRNGTFRFPGSVPSMSGY